MVYQRPLGSRPGYTLVELMVVLLITSLMAGMGVPSLTSGDDRFLLNNEARKIKQMIDEARVSSKAPTKNDGAGSQVFQVSFGPFASQAAITAQGNDLTNRVTLERGVANCATKELKGALTKVRELQLSRGIKIAEFFPANLAAGDSQATVRFAVGSSGFRCGPATSPSNDSANFADPVWQGAANQQARFALVKLVSKNVGQAAYLAIDRLNGQTELFADNPQAYFSPVLDNFSPKWRPFLPAGLSVSCGTNSSLVGLIFSRADDRFEADEVNASRILFYDIYGKIGPSGGPTADYKPLFTKYFYDLTANEVIFIFRTDLVTTTVQPAEFSFRVWAIDGFGNYQGDPGPVELSYRDLNFAKPTDWDCGGQISGSFSRFGSHSDPNFGLGKDPFFSINEPGVNDLFFDPFLPPTSSPNEVPGEPVPSCTPNEGPQVRRWVERLLPRAVASIPDCA